MSEATQHSTQIFLDSKAHTLSSVACFPQCVPRGIHWYPEGGRELLVDTHFGKHYVKQVS